MHSQQCAPLHQPMKSPPLFEVVSLSGQTVFAMEKPLCPRGSNFPTTKEAPVGIATSQNGVTSTRQTLAAVQAASGIAFIPNSKESEAIPASWFAASISSELAHAMENMGKQGPHKTCRSRSISISLLLPNQDDVSFHYANALATLISVPPSSMGDTGTATGRRKRPLAARARFNIAAGRADIAEILAFLKVSSRDWKDTPCLLVSYLQGKNQCNALYKLDANISSAQMAFRELKSQCVMAQQASEGHLVLPAAMLDVSTNESTMCTSDAFESLMIELQNETKELFCPSVDVSPVCGTANFSLPWGDNAKSFVRVVSPCRPGEILQEVDPRHCPGILLTQEQNVESWDQSVTHSYVKRSSMTSELDPLTQRWHLYILSPPREEELNIGVSVLWFPVERVSLGPSISTFGIRSAPGEAVTCFPDSDIFRVQPRVQLISELLSHAQCPKWVLPVTTESAVCSRFESQGSFIHSINRNFFRLMNESMESVLKPRSPHKLVHVNSMCSVASVASEMSTDSPRPPRQDAEQGALFALTQALPGSRTATVGDLYAHLGEHSDTFTSGLLVSFHGMLSAAVAAGRSRDTLKRLFDETAEHIRGGHVSEEANKRAKSPVSSPMVVAPATPVAPVLSAAAGSTVATASPEDTGSTSNATSYTQGSESANARVDMWPQLRGLGMCSVGEEILLPKRCSMDGAKQLLKLLARVDPTLSKIKASDLNTTSKEKNPKGAQWMHFLMEVLGRSPLLKDTPHMCGSESPAAKKPPGFFEFQGGEYKVVEQSDFVCKPKSKNQLKFWFSAKAGGFPFGCTIFIKPSSQSSTPSP